MAKTTTLKERGTGAVLYPQTIPSQVIFPDGTDLNDALESQSNVTGVPIEMRIEAIEPTLVTEALRKVPQSLTPEEQAQVKDNLGISKMELFIDMWNEAAIARGSWNSKQKHGRYNEDTGYFELNGLTDITYGEAVMIYESWIGRKTFYNCRANLPINTQAGYQGSAFTNNTYLVALWGNRNSNAVPEFTSAQNCGKIRDFRYFKIKTLHGYAFQGWESLEHIEGLEITAKGTMDLHWSPLLSIESIQNIIAANPEGNIIKPHPTVYAKLTGDTTNEEVAAMDPDELAQWMQIVTDAAAKNITFIAA